MFKQDIIIVNSEVLLLIIPSGRRTGSIKKEGCDMNNAIITFFAVYEPSIVLTIYIRLSLIIRDYFWPVIRVVTSYI